MIMKFLIAVLLPITFTAALADTPSKDMKEHPERYIDIPQWSVYSAWGGVGILHTVRIVNRSNATYKNIKVRIYYASTSRSSAGPVVSQQKGVIPVTVPPESSDTYIREGIPFGANSQFMDPVSIEVLGAEYVP